MLLPFVFKISFEFVSHDYFDDDDDGEDMLLTAIVLPTCGSSTVHTNTQTHNTQNDTKQTIYGTTHKFWKGVGRAPSLRV